MGGVYKEGHVATVTVLPNLAQLPGARWWRSFSTAAHAMCFYARDQGNGAITSFYSGGGRVLFASTPALTTATEAFGAGETEWDSSLVYRRTATNTRKRSIAAWQNVAEWIHFANNEQSHRTRQERAGNAEKWAHKFWSCVARPCVVYH
jgi:hypothetical protein